ncbi:MAG: amidohydrolase family protein [Candidatus Aenigmarchaeota archaeon]|nr:amidohydrolase family protein [Candidatus Aenigmarchaeota archaeon]
MIIDFHVHYGQDIDGQNTTMEQISRGLVTNGVYKTVVFPFNSGRLLEDSRKIYEMSRDRISIIPFLRFDPSNISQEDLRKALDMGYKGVKLHPTSQRFYPDDPNITWIYDEISRYKIPILFHCNTSVNEPMAQPSHVLNLAERYPDQIFVLGHCIGGDVSPFEEVSRYSNVYVDTSVDSYKVLYERVWQMFKFDRFVFGSDFPYSDVDIELLKIQRANVQDDLKEKILYKNACKILGLNMC